MFCIVRDNLLRRQEVEGSHLSLVSLYVWPRFRQGIGPGHQEPAGTGSFCRGAAKGSSGAQQWSLAGMRRKGVPEHKRLASAECSGMGHTG